jgi:hypothetical protein
MIQSAQSYMAAYSYLVPSWLRFAANPSVETVFTYLTAACRVSWIPSAAAVRAGDDFKQVAVRVFEVDTASAVVVIDLP